nr:ankyrin repeat domain-containing protein [Parashewanella hymeniacidonis]
MDGWSFLANKLIILNANVDAKDSEGTPALILALLSKNSNLVRVLLKAGAKVNVSQEDGNTALMQAVRSGDFDIFEQLLDKTTDVNAVSKKGWSALYLAAGFNRPMMLECLLEKGARLFDNGPNDSPLINTVNLGHITCARLLVEHANKAGLLPKLVQVKNGDRKTALQLAKALNKHPEYIEYLSSILEDIVFSISLQERSMREFDIIESPTVTSDTKL